MNKLKILQVAPKFIMAGAETMCTNLSLGLKDNGHEVMVVSLFNYQSSLTKMLEEAGIIVKYLDKKKGFDYSIYKKIEKIIKDFKPDIIHTHLYVAPYVIPIAKKLHIKVKVHTIHNIEYKNNSLKQKYAHYIYHHQDVMPVALSNEVAKSISDTFNLDINKIPIILNGEDTSRFNIKNDYTFDRLNIVHIGRFVEIKNQELIIELAKILKEEKYNFKITLIGDNNTPYGIYLKELIEKESLNNVIDIIGPIDNVEDYLNKADIFILPSLTEGVPMTLIEAMSCALPIVVSNVGGIKDILTNNDNALLINPNINELSSAIKDLANDLEKREKLGKNALINSKRFNREIMCSNYEKLYYELLNERNNHD